MKDEKIKRINELSRKSKSQGLTEDEKREQYILRQEYINAVKLNLRSKLDNVVIVDEKGNKKTIKKKTIN